MTPSFSIVSAETVTRVERGRGYNWGKFIVRLAPGNSVLFQGCTPKQINNVKSSVKYTRRSRGFKYQMMIREDGILVKRKPE